MKKQKKETTATATRKKKLPGVVKKLPLAELWDSEQVLDAQRMKFLTTSKIPAMLKRKNVRLVLARLGYEPLWVDPADNAAAWKNELKGMICDKLDEGCSLDEFPGDYFYFASYWETADKEPVLLFELYQ